MTLNENIIREIRLKVIEMAEHSPHVAAAFSCVDILAVLYFEILQIHGNANSDCMNDRFILSKGHGCMALYAVLAQCGIIDQSLLSTYCQNGSFLGGHTFAGKVPGIIYSSGSLGHGLAVGAGRAKAMKMKGQSGRVFVMLGDGECEEGSVWEAASVAALHNLDNLVAIIDHNGWQACGQYSEISSSTNLNDRWRSCGWETEVVDGHNIEILKDSFARKIEVAGFV